MTSPMVSLAVMGQVMVLCSQRLNLIVSVFLDWDCPRSETHENGKQMKKGAAKSALTLEYRVITEPA